MTKEVSLQVEVRLGDEEDGGGNGQVQVGKAAPFYNRYFFPCLQNVLDYRKMLSTRHTETS